MRRSPHLLAALSIVALLSLAALHASASGGDKTLTVPETKWAKRVPGLFVEPRFAAPAFVEPGGQFTLKLSGKLQVKEAYIDDGYGHRFTLQLAELPEGGAYRATVPKDAPPGVYDLFLDVEGKGLVGEPHAVVVGKPEMYKRLYIVHVTDRHFGVVNSNGRAASNYDLAAVTLALSLPNNTIIADTGDVADTAKREEYLESLWTDYLLDKPLIGIPGNHDHVGGFVNYNLYRGPWNYTLSIFGLYRVVGIDSGGDGYINVDQARWAASVLKGSGEPVKIVMFHHPHFTHLFGDVKYNFTLGSWEQLYKVLTSKKPGSKYLYVYSSWLQNKKAFQTLVEGMYDARYKRMLVLSGHVHLNSYAEVHKPDGSTINYVVTVATGGSVREGDYHGFRVLMLSSSGGFKAYGEAPVQYRNSSFNLEPVHVAYVKGPAAVTMAFSITGETRFLNLMNRTVVALPIPKEYAGKKLNVYLKGLEGYRLRCTPLGCVLYAYNNSKPLVGKVYQVTLYTREDREKPTLMFVRMMPRSPRTGSQVLLQFRIGDDAWGISSVKAYIEYNGKRMEVKPSIIGSTMRIVVPPLHNVDKVKVHVEVADASGKKTVWSHEITYQKPAPTTATAAATAAARETATQQTTATPTGTTAATAAATTATTTSTQAAETAAATTGEATATGATTTGETSTPASPTASPTVETTATSSTTAAAAGGGASAALVVGALVIAAIAFLAVVSRRAG